MHWIQYEKLFNHVDAVGRFNSDFSISDLSITCCRASRGRCKWELNWTACLYAKEYSLFSQRLQAKAASILVCVGSYRVQENGTARLLHLKHLFHQRPPTPLLCEDWFAATKTKNVRWNRRCVLALRALEPFCKLMERFLIIRVVYVTAAVMKVLLSAYITQWIAQSQVNALSQIFAALTFAQLVWYPKIIIVDATHWRD